MSTKRTFFIGLFLFSLFVFLSYLVHKNLFTHFDFNMTVRLQDHMPRRFDDFFSFLSLIGRFEIMTVVLLVILLIRFKWQGLIVLLFYGVIHIFELFGKTFVNHLPPPHFMLRTHLPFNFPEFYVSTENSYPSGHAARAFFITTLIALFIYKTKRISIEMKYVLWMCLLGYDLIMCLSRVYLGEHWTSDVIGGSLLGASLSLFSLLLF